MATVELVKQDASALGVQEIAAKIEDALAAGRKALWELAEALHTFDEMRGWRELGFSTLSEWLEATDGAITRGTYYRLVGTWRKLVVELEVDAERVYLLDQSKVAIVADRIGENRVSVDDALADVEALPAQGLREKYGRPAVGRRPKAQAGNHPALADSGHKPEGGDAAERVHPSVGAVATEGACPTCGRRLEEESAR